MRKTNGAGGFLAGLRLLTITDAAEILGVSRNTLDGMIDNGKIGYVELNEFTKRIPMRRLIEFSTKIKIGVKK